MIIWIYIRTHLKLYILLMLSQEIGCVKSLNGEYMGGGGGGGGGGGKIQKWFLPFTIRNDSVK